METKKQYALVRQVVTARNGWYSDVLAVYENFNDAQAAVKAAVKVWQGIDPQIALRELDCVFGEKLRLGWCSNKLDNPLGQFIVIAL